MKIAFVQESGKQQHGVMILSAVLKERQFETRVFSLELDGDSLIDGIEAYDPQLIGCTMMTPGCRALVGLLERIKRRVPGAFFIVGGPHPTFYPEMLGPEGCVDAICIGEGEQALLELATSLRDGKPALEVLNLHIRADGRIRRNGKRDLIRDLDGLPFPDRDIYFEKYPRMASGDVKFNVGRGCPFDCSYCFNKGMKDLYRGQGPWTRFKSVDRVIREIQHVRENYPIRWVNFNDDTFNVRKDWVMEFLRRYKAEIGIPFLCQLRIDCATEEQIQLLKEAGVDRITVGIEHGDEAVRRNLLKRDISNRQILDFGRWIRERAIRLHTTNIMGLPEETLEQAFSTIDLNAQLRPELAISNILNPYPGTAVYAYAKENGYLEDGFDFNDLTGQNVWSIHSRRIKGAIRNEAMPLLINLRCFFMLLVLYPWMKPLVRALIRLPGNFLFEFVWRVTSYFRVEWKYATSWKERWTYLRRLVK